MQAEYTNALATLGIKSVTFHSTIYQSDSEKVRTNCGSNIRLGIYFIFSQKHFSKSTCKEHFTSTKTDLHQFTALGPFR